MRCLGSSNNGCRLDAVVMVFHRLVFIGVFLSGICLTAAADFNAGVRYYRAGDFMRAAIEFHIAAEKGDPKAQLNLGLLYDQGLGVDQDYTEAAKWYRSSALQGVQLAMLNLASLHFEGLGVSQSDTEAFGWYEKAALAGNPTAQYNLSVMFEEGLGTETDPIKAMAWLDLAAANGAIVTENEKDRLKRALSASQAREATRLFEKLRETLPSGESSP